MDPVFLTPPPPDRADWLRFKGSVVAAKLLVLAGWRIDWHGVPAKHGIIVAYPHTSNWDFIVGILTKWAVGIPVKFWAKEGLFTGLARYTLGPWMRYLGAVPVNRKAASGMIDDTLSRMKASDFFWLALAPEGTRSRTPYWRSGFYRLAHAAQCPLGLAAFDFKHKRVVINTFVTLTGDEVADMAQIQAYYSAIANGCVPDNASPVALQSTVQAK